MAAVLFVALLLIFGSPVFASDADLPEDVNTESHSNSPEEGKFYLTPLPIIAYGPAHGWTFGAAMSAGVYLGNPETTSMSNALVTGSYTTLNQVLFTMKSTVYTDENLWQFIGDWRLFFSSQPTYGLGTGGLNTNPEDLDFNLIRFHQTAARSVAPGLSVGLGYHLDMYSQIADYAMEEDGFSSHYDYSIRNGFDPEGYTTTGLSANLIYDTRDNVANPYTGRFAFASFRMNPEFMGSSRSSSSLWLEYRDYFNVDKSNPRHLIGVWTYGNFTTSGVQPYMNLPSLGWDQMGRSGRAFGQGHFRGENLYYAEVEYRFPLPIIKNNPDLLGGTVFVNMTTASNSYENVALFDHVVPAVGVGLRIMLQKESRANLTIDYAINMNGEGALYLNLNEVF